MHCRKSFSSNLLADPRLADKEEQVSHIFKRLLCSIACCHQVMDHGRLTSDKFYNKNIASDVVKAKRHLAKINREEGIALSVSEEVAERRRVRESLMIGMAQEDAEKYISDAKKHSKKVDRSFTKPLKFFFFH